MSKIISPGRDKPLVADNAPTQRVTTWMQIVSGAAQTIEGNGSPEGLIEGLLGWEYVDRDVFQFYRKTNNGTKNGWIANAPPLLQDAFDPEGQVNGILGQEYFNTVGLTFFKKTIDGGNTGWSAIT